MASSTPNQSGANVLLMHSLNQKGNRYPGRNRREKIINEVRIGRRIIMMTRIWIMLRGT